MKALLVADTTAPFQIEPSDGTAAIQVTPGSTGGGSGTAEFAQLDIPVPTLTANQFANINGQDTTGLFPTPLQPGDFVWVNALYVSSAPLTFAAAIECTAQDTVAIAVVAFDTGNPSPGTMTVKIGRVPLPV